MTAAAASFRDNVSPAELVRTALRMGELAFAREYGDAPFLAIRATGDAASVAAGLDATLAGATTRLARPIGAMGFHTEIASAKDLARVRAESPRRAGGGDVSLDRLFAEGAVYLVALKKRQDVDAAFADRISIGRAPNKDIVLRHTSISKFHAWFQFDDMSGVYVADAGSTNGTRLNSDRLTPREPVRLDLGDQVTFGSIESILCDARAIWRALHHG